MRLRVNVEGRPYEVEVDFLNSAPAENADRRPAEAPIPRSVLRPRPPQRLPEDSSCRSPIAGRVAAIVGAVGGKVRRHQAVVVIEAMKMEIAIGPAVDGTVTAIHVGPGDAVKTGQVLFELC
ncbi:MAG TPA: acetyl-CoA carboxylase biotin carboxyl carrier protein subunit [Tepidisphaeraceae bacterium]|nr:acetyl-CoA carboxylase biotin carboxyl carrier protein subunit [Tepidisphaeraceae bacterium]